MDRATGFVLGFLICFLIAFFWRWIICRARGHAWTRWRKVDALDAPPELLTAPPHYPGEFSVVMVEGLEKIVPAAAKALHVWRRHCARKGCPTVEWKVVR